MGINKIFLTGVVSKDVEKRFTPNGVAVANMVLGVPSANPKESNAMQFVRCTAWRNVAENMEQNLRKGDNVLVEGKLITNSFVDKEGNKKRVTEVEISNVTALSQAGSAAQSEASQSAPDDTFEELYPSSSNDDMPF